MNNIIDINDVSSYPKEIVKTFFDNVGGIKFDALFNSYYFKCVHVCCTTDIENYKKYGIMRPLIANNCDTFEINQILKEIILKPIKEYKEYSKKYDELLEENFNESKGKIVDWYGKYSCVCYTLDGINKIVSEDPGYDPLINFYGGEIFRNIGISYQEAELIAKKYKAYAIFFKLHYDEINQKCIMIEDIYKHMKKMFLGEKSEYGFENRINKDISPNDFIEICEVKNCE